MWCLQQLIPFCYHVWNHLRRRQPKRTTEGKTEGIPEERNQNFNQNLTFSGCFYYLSVKYSLSNSGRVLCTVESTLMVLPYWLPRVFVSATCLAVASAIPVGVEKKYHSGKIAGRRALPATGASARPLHSSQQQLVVSALVSSYGNFIHLGQSRLLLHGEHWENQETRFWHLI